MGFQHTYMILKNSERIYICAFLHILYFIYAEGLFRMKDNAHVHHINTA